MRRGNGSKPSPARTLARMPVRMAVAGLAVLALTAACGSLPATNGGGPGHVTTPSHSGPQWQTRAGSEQIAAQLLTQLRLPASARHMPQRPLPPGLRLPAYSLAAKDYVDRYLVFRLPMSMTAALRYLRAHVPAGMTLQGSGSSSSASGVIERDLTFVPRRTPWGIYSLDLTDTVVRGAGGHTLLRSDAEVIWYPARSAAEHLSAAQFRSVQIVAFVAGVATRTVSKTFTSPAVIARLVALLNSEPASPGEVVFCPIITVTYRLAFRPVAGHPAVVVNRYGCTGDSITVGGVAQPALADLGKLPALIDKLLKLHEPVLRRPVAVHTTLRPASSR